MITFSHIENYRENLSRKLVENFVKIFDKIFVGNTKYVTPKLKFIYSEKATKFYFHAQKIIHFFFKDIVKVS